MAPPDCRPVVVVARRRWLLARGIVDNAYREIARWEDPTMSAISRRSALFVGVLAWAFSAERCRADISVGVDGYVDNADVVLVVQAQTGPEANAFPAPAGKLRLRVLEVLKGITPDQYMLLPANTVRPGGKAVILIAADGPMPYEPLVNPAPCDKRIHCWPIDDKGKVNTGRVPAKSHGGFDFSVAEVTVPSIRAEVAASSPDEVGLYGQVLDACLFPEKMADLDRKNPRRAQFVRMMAAVRDLDRDVPAVAGLLESAGDAIQIP